MVAVKAGSSELGTAKTFDKALDVIFLGLPANGGGTGSDTTEPTLSDLVQEYRDQRTKQDVERNRLFDQILEKIAEDDR